MPRLAITQTLDALDSVTLDKPELTRLALSCIVAGGHLLLQDVPGMGKTVLAHALAKVLGLDFRRVQFTSDMLPADILGMMIFQDGQFTYQKGAIFTQILLADEINRASPKTQSALLEAMEERQVSVEGRTYALPVPFFVIATQNPLQEAGVYPLPQSQLDRFLFCLSMGYPSFTAERALLVGEERRTMLNQLGTTLPQDLLLQAQMQAQSLHVEPVVLDYMQALAQYVRTNGVHFSVRALLALKRAACAYAYVGGHDFVSIEDVRAVFAPLIDHRAGTQFHGQYGARVLDEVVVPA